jgi:hypothetical protein
MSAVGADNPSANAISHFMIFSLPGQLLYPMSGPLFGVACAAKFLYR